MKTFGANLTDCINDALTHGVPPQEIILCLEVTKIELVNSLLANRTQEQSAEPPGPLIVLPNGDASRMGQ